MTPVLFRSRLLPVAALAMLAACGDEEPIAPVATMPVTAARLEQLAAAIEPVSEQPVLQSMTFGFGFGRGLPVDDDPFGGPFGYPVLRGDGGRGVAREVVFVPIGGDRMPIAIPDSVRGRTYVRGEGYGTLWRLDTLPGGAPRPGAPANGVRFIVTPFDLSVAATPLGWMDVTQPGSASAPSLLVEVFDTAGTRVQRFGGAPTGDAITGFTQRGGTAVDQALSISRTGARTTWTSATLGLAAYRRDLRPGTQTGIDVDGFDLAIEEVVSTRTLTFTYTVLVDGAPFARRVDAVSMLAPRGTWQHVAEGRPLNEGERAQVNALVRALRAIPDAEEAWMEGLTALLSIQRPPLPFP